MIFIIVIKWCFKIESQVDLYIDFSLLEKVQMYVSLLVDVIIFGADNDFLLPIYNYLAMPGNN